MLAWRQRISTVSRRRSAAMPKTRPPGLHRAPATADRRLLTAGDLMTTRPVTVSPETTVVDIARLLSERGISAVPVIDARARLVGIVSEGDLMRRAETGTERRRPWWLALLTSPTTLANEYAHTHGARAADVMTSDVVTVTEATPATRIATLLETRRIKRVPVVRRGRLVGIVSRADLIRALAAIAASGELASGPSDQMIRAQLLREVESAAWAIPGFINPIVAHGIVHLWGVIGSEAERHALHVAAMNIQGVRAIRDHLRRGDG